MMMCLLAVPGWGKGAHMSQIRPGFGGENCGRKVQATKSLSEIQIDVRCGCEDEGCMRKILQVFRSIGTIDLGMRLA